MFSTANVLFITFKVVILIQYTYLHAKQRKRNLFHVSQRGLKQKHGESESRKQTLKTFRHESLKVIRWGAGRGRLPSNAAHARPRRKSPLRRIHCF